MMMDERSCLPGFSARQGEQEVHGVVCISDGDGLGALLAPGSFGRPLLPLPPGEKPLAWRCVGFL